MITLHLGGIPEASMVLGPVLLIIAFLRIARRNEATAGDDRDGWNADLGDLPESSGEVRTAAGGRTGCEGRAAESCGGSSYGTASGGS
jgi:hypothetical protein